MVHQDAQLLGFGILKMHECEGSSCCPSRNHWLLCTSTCSGPRLFALGLKRVETDLRRAEKRTGIKIVCEDRLDDVWRKAGRLGIGIVTGANQDLQGKVFLSGPLVKKLRIA